MCKLWPERTAASPPANVVWRPYPAHLWDMGPAHNPPPRKLNGRATARPSTPHTPAPVGADAQDALEPKWLRILAISVRIATVGRTSRKELEGAPLLFDRSAFVRKTVENG